MSTRQVPAPLFPYPPTEYQQQYFADIVRAFGVFVEQQRNPGEARATKMTMTNLPSNFDVSLETGALFEVDGFVKISKLNAPHPQGNGSTTTLGSVSVTIS
jgi:hypothetical protein